jgi:K+-sensing histidine kinase KdpD
VAHGGGTLDAPLRGMASTASTSRLRVNSTGQPNLRLISSDGLNDLDVTRASAQSAKTAVIACLTGCSLDNSNLLHKASVAARERDGKFYAVVIDSPQSRFGMAQVRTLIDDAILASHLGAKIVWLESSDRVGDLLRLARQLRIGRIFVHRSRPAWFFRVFGRTTYSDLLSRAQGISIDVVGF